MKALGKRRAGQPDSVSQIRYLPRSIGFSVDALERPMNDGVGQCGEKGGLNPLQLTAPQHLHEDNLSQS